MLQTSKHIYNMSIYFVMNIHLILYYSTVCIPNFKHSTIAEDTALAMTKNTNSTGNANLSPVHKGAKITFRTYGGLRNIPVSSMTGESYTVNLELIFLVAVQYTNALQT